MLNMYLFQKLEYIFGQFPLRIKTKFISKFPEVAFKIQNQSLPNDGYKVTHKHKILNMFPLYPIILQSQSKLFISQVAVAIAIYHTRIFMYVNIQGIACNNCQQKHKCTSTYVCTYIYMYVRTYVKENICKFLEAIFQ